MFDTYYEFLWLFNKKKDCKNDSRLVAIDNRSLTDDWLEMDHRPLAENETKVSKISRIPMQYPIQIIKHEARVIARNPFHLLHPILPPRKRTVYNLRKLMD